MTGIISWYAVRVAPRAEFRVRTAFNRLERPTILPSGERSVRRSDRPNLKRMRPYPIIPGYVFGGFFDFGDFLQARKAVNEPLERMGQARDVLGVIGFAGKPAVLKPNDVVMLSTLTEEPQVETVPLSIGQEVVVLGQRTKVHTINTKKREFTAFVEMLGGMQLITSGFDATQAA